MVQTVYLIAQEGMDRILVQSTQPSNATLAEWRRSKPTKVWVAEIEIPDVTIVDGYVHVQAKEVRDEPVVVPMRNSS